MTPAVDDVAARIGKTLRIVKLNTASESQALRAFGIASVPMLLLFATDGRELARHLGSLTSPAIIGWIARNSASTCEV